MLSNQTKNEHVPQELISEEQLGNQGANPSILQVLSYSSETQTMQRNECDINRMQERLNSIRKKHEK